MDTSNQTRETSHRGKAKLDKTTDQLRQPYETDKIAMFIARVHSG